MKTFKIELIPAGRRTKVKTAVVGRRASRSQEDNPIWSRLAIAGRNLRSGMRIEPPIYESD